MQHAAGRWIVATAVLFLCQSANGQPVRLTLDEAVARAITANLELNANRRDLDVAAANLQRSKAWLPSNPYLSTGAQYTSQIGVGENYVFLLSQEFEVAGQRKRRIETAAKGVELTAWELKNAEQELSKNVKTAFVEALVQVDRVTVAQQAVDATAELTSPLSELTRRLSDPERLNLNGVLIQANRVQRDLAAAEQARDNALGALRLLLALPPEREIELVGAPKSEVRELPASAELVERALRQRADLAAVRLGVQRADLQLRLTKRESIPNITLSSTVSRFQGDTLVGGDVGLPLPIFQRRTGEIQEAVAERERVNLQLQNLERYVANEVLEARRACTVAGGDLQTFQHDTLPRVEENLQIELRLYDRREVTLFDVISAQAELTAARREYLDMLESYNLALIQLERTTGGSIEGP